MNDAQFRALRPGSLVRHKHGKDAYIVHANYGGRVTALRHADLTNPSEWDEVGPMGQLIGPAEANAILAGWSAMDSAPRDGTTIDLLMQWPDGSFSRWADARWREAGDHNCYGLANWCSADPIALHGYLDELKPVGWMRVALPDFAEVPADA